MLIVGGTRFLGHELAWRMLAAGHQLTLFNRGTREDAFGDRVERFRGDRRGPDFARLLAGRSFDAAVDFAAYDAVDGRQAAEVLDGRVGHYLAISSGQVYLVREGCRRPAREVDYEGPLRAQPPDGPDRGEWEYGMGKRALEEALEEAWQARRFPATRLRLPMVNGPRDHFRRLECYLWRMLDDVEVLLPGGGDHRVRHVWSASVVAAILGLLGRRASFGEAYNLAQQETPTLRELLLMLGEALGAQVRLVAVEEDRLRSAGLDPLALSPFSGRWMSFLDPSRAQAELGFRHEPLASCLDKVVTSFLAHPAAEPPPGYERRAEERALAEALRASAPAAARTGG
ncbi:MAG TPA: NAD-dependent epimerase/dehydratase family protein [Vicinamibacteria bacterium]|nr:NAD-dependent epimerase/dehydratase family protein [Vicinamibacteria bacterium]